jgi:hypothetical protein
LIAALENLLLISIYTNGVFAEMFRKNVVVGATAVLRNLAGGNFLKHPV